MNTVRKSTESSASCKRCRMFINLEETAEFLKNCDNAIIITHQSPDGDCIGAGFALKDILSEL